MTEPAQDQNSQFRTRRTLRLLSSFNPTLFRVQDEHELFTESCRRIVEIGDYLMAWVGFAQQNENKSILPAASFGHEEGYLEDLSITWKDNDLGRGPLGTAIRTGVTQISRNLLPEPSLVLRHKAPNRCQSSISLPLADNNKIFGALTIYAPEPDAFKPDEAKLLEVLASDLVIKMINIRSHSEVEELRSESKIARETLQSIELRFHLILDALNEGVTLLDETFRIALVNRSLCHILDYTPEEMLGHHLEEFAIDADQKQLRKHLEVLPKGDNSSIECRFRRKDGEARWLKSTDTVFKDGQGALEGVIAMFTDVTESKRVQRDMQLMKASFESLGEPFCRATKDAQIDFVNAELCRVLGYSQEEMLAMKISDYDEDLSAEKWPEHWEQLKKSGSLTFESSLRAKSGDIFPVEVKERYLRVEGEEYSCAYIQNILARKKLESESSAIEAVYSSVVETTADCFWKADMEGHLLEVNEAYVQLSGYSRKELMNMNIQELDANQSPDEMAEHFKNVLRDGYVRFETLQRSKDGNIWPAEVVIRYVPLEEGRIIAFCRDLTESRQKDASLKLASHIYLSASEAVMITNENDLIVHVNPAFTQQTGYTLEEVVGKSPQMMRSSQHDESIDQEMWRELQNNGRWQGELHDLRKDGSEHIKHANISLIRHDDETVFRHVTQFLDLTDIKKKAETYEGEDNSGVLVELPNRRLFLDRLEQGIKKSQRTGSPLALLVINLGLGNDVNIVAAKVEENVLLVEVARRIMKCVRETDTVAHLGGDEFIMVLPEFGKRIHLERITRDIIRALTQPYDPGTCARSSVSASIGIAIYPDDTGSIEELMSHANQAMHAAKEKGNSHFNYFTPAMQKEAQEKLALTNDLKQALARNELEIYFQPIVDFAEERITKAEALLRWKHPTRGMVSPVIFIPLAEESRLILEIGDWVFEEVIASIDRWRQQFGRIVQICVNKSLVQFEEDSINPWMDRLVSTGLPGNCVTVGITEGLFIKDSAKVKQRLQDFRRAGIEVSIDDFGTGFSALSYLKEFDINYIKIGLSLVSDLIENGRNKALTEAIIVMAHKLGIKTIAEGVETQAQSDLLREFGCDYLQGYLYSRPLVKEDFEKMLEK